MPRNTISIETRAQICVLRDLGWSLGEIAKYLGVSKNSVKYNYKKRTETGIIFNRKKSGRPKILNDRAARYFVRKIITGKFKNATELQKSLLNEDGIEYSTQTIRRALKRNGLRSYSKIKKPLLRKVHRLKRRKFAKRYGTWTVENWNQVVGQMKQNSIYLDRMVSNIVGANLRMN